ncbi:polysaccharide deacetylase family protein [Chitinimonas sp. BJB300]|nr:polysaccharide deacetylase family protein [Chitinimonas sp. BJB300]PHV12108.1 polysaccharide deacetylase [Chitinimonas sp. BJB300]TSJ89064.1 polysaccharide deacetylase family protein [Chitinimonas sp. BJB300]
MKVLLTFDVEVWCNGWNALDQVFPSSFERYVYGRSAQGDYALPKTLEILNQHGLHGVFFVEPLFAARFGQQYLDTIVQMILAAGQEVQLHLHPEWTDEITTALIPNNQVKRQHLSYYDLDEQTALIAHGKKMLLEAGAEPITTFRAGSFAANRDTFLALQRNGIHLDSSLNRFYPISGMDMRDTHNLLSPLFISGVHSYPVTVFRDGFGREKPAQVSGCSFTELRSAMLNGWHGGQEMFVIVSHNFELLKPDSALPDAIVVRRFEQLCAFLGAQQQRLPTVSYRDCKPVLTEPPRLAMPRASTLATTRRYAEQLLRRL